jgi:hypothetical protein
MRFSKVLFVVGILSGSLLLLGSLVNLNRSLVFGLLLLGVIVVLSIPVLVFWLLLLRTQETRNPTRNFSELVPKLVLNREYMTMMNFDNLSFWAAWILSACLGISFFFFPTITVFYYAAVIMAVVVFIFIFAWNLLFWINVFMTIISSIPKKR